MRIAMFPPEIAITWYVPASCSRRWSSSDNPDRSPIRIAAAIATRLAAPASHVDRKLPTRPRPRGGGCLIDRTAPGNHVHERSTLDRANEDDAAAGEGPNLVGHSGVSVHGGDSQDGGHRHSTAAPPGRDRIASGPACDRQTCASSPHDDRSPSSHPRTSETPSGLGAASSRSTPSINAGSDRSAASRPANHASNGGE